MDYKDEQHALGAARELRAVATTAAPPISLADPEGVIRAWMCPRCGRVAKESAYPASAEPDTIAARAAASHEKAAQCCLCRRCGTQTMFYNYLCDACRATEEAERAARLEGERPERERKESILATALTLALDEDAAIRLRDRMSNISEWHYCAGWLDGLEYSLWSILGGAGDTRFGMHDVSHHDIAELARLADKSGGWWMWDEDLGAQVFIRLAEWRRLYADRTGTWITRKDNADG